MRYINTKILFILKCRVNIISVLRNSLRKIQKLNVKEIIIITRYNNNNNNTNNNNNNNNSNNSIGIVLK